MRKKGISLLGGFILASTPVWAAPPTVQGLVNQFSPANYQNVLSNRLYTQPTMNKGSNYGDQHNPCRDAILNEFQNAGLAPALDPFSYYAGAEGTINGWNIVAVKPGVQNPSNEIYVVSAHYDSVSNPGADDDCSGVACLLELARIFSRQYFAKTLVLVAFDAEERIDAYGNIHPGSLHYVDQHHTDRIRGMISVDMIAHPVTGTNDAYLWGLPVSIPYQNDVRTIMTNNGCGLNIVREDQQGNSDHINFSNGGFPACIFTEGDRSNNPYHHKAGDYADSPGNLDWAYGGKMCRSLIGYYATQLGIVDVTPRAVSLKCNAGGSATVHFCGLPGCRYAIESNTNLVNGSWKVIGTNTAAAADGTFVSIDPPVANRGSCFYRARFVPPD